MNRSKKEYPVLTKSEMDVMKILWQIGDEATVKDILARYTEPKPAYTTVATFLKILTAKGYLSESKHLDMGKALYYKPLLSQEEYTSRVMDEVTTDFFGGSVGSLVNFFVREEKISVSEIEKLLQMIKDAELRH